ncbi:hypothetical protein GCM10010191_36290 [Actinomadura vinacea]|uniref:Uncharacterized protein n=1 Tax=Actinomadura vinacea TaxID=115336 RepID=A0ABN3J5M8_9ACTN
MSAANLIWIEIDLRHVPKSGSDETLRCARIDLDVILEQSDAYGGDETNYLCHGPREEPPPHCYNECSTPQLSEPAKRASLGKLRYELLPA